MKIQKFEDIIGWQKTQDFAVVKDFSYKNQITRVVVSISNNIA